MKEMFLLGAGASVEAGISSSYNMAKQMLKRISSDSRFDHQGKLLKFVLGGLLFQQGIKGNNPFEGVNIEDLFNTVNLLGDRRNSELGPFIGSWHAQLDELDSGKLSAPTSNRLIQSIKESVESIQKDGLSIFGYQSRPLYGIDFESELSKAIHEIITGGNGRLFAETAKVMIHNLIGMVWLRSSDTIQYFIPLIKYSQKNETTIASLNYDNTIELAGEISGIDVDTGFEAWSSTGEFSFKKGSIPLIKLHGSIDWALSSGPLTKEKPLTYQIIQQVNPNTYKEKSFEPAVLFGGKNKLTAKGPFLGLLRSFEKKLIEAEQLVVIGYSFRDEHVNEFIGNWFNGNQSRRIKIIDPMVNEENELIHQLNRVDAKGRVQKIIEKASIGILQVTNSL